MTVDIEQIKAANAIEGVIGEDEELETGRGRYVRGRKHDSLVVDRKQQVYYWNSAGQWGDVIEWLQRQRGMDFRQAVEHLAQRGGLPEPQWGSDAQAAAAYRVITDTLTVACRWWASRLWQDETALEYARWRGWNDETIRAAMLGYVGSDARGLRAELQMHNCDLSSNAAKAVLQAPAGMLVYPCIRGGRVVYFACRTAAKDKDKKRHWNPPGELIGDRQPFYNHEYNAADDLVVVVEGQADAVTLGQWGIAGMALGGMALADTEGYTRLVQTLRRHQTTAIGLDKGATGAVRKVADTLGPMVRVIEWPCKDANDWLQEGATADEARALIEGSPIWAQVRADDVGKMEGTERQRELRRLFDLIGRMEEFDLAMYRPGLARSIGLNLRQFGALLKATRAASNGHEAQDEQPSEPLAMIEIPGGLVDNHLIEMMVIAPEGGSGAAGQLGSGWKTVFAAKTPEGNIKTLNFIDAAGIRYRPIDPSNRILTEQVVHFPSAIGERVELRELVRWIQRTIRKYVDVDIFYETLAAYYVLFSWLYDAFNTLPYLRMIGDAGTGKSRFIQVAGAMCYRPTFVTGAATTSPIFRMLDQYRGTLILDEADYRVSDEKADIIKILNTGYQRTQGVVLRSGDKNQRFETEVYVVYGPKVVATRKRFADWALESRCLTYEAGGPTTRTDIPIDLPRAFWTEEAVAIRNALLRFRLENWRPEIELDYARMDATVEPRLNQVTVALQTLIDDEDLQNDLKGFIQEYNRQLTVERGMTLTAKVLEALTGCWFWDLQENRVPDMRMQRIAKGVNVLIDRENEGEDGEEESEGDEGETQAEGADKGKGRGRKGGPFALRVTPKKVGELVRKQLHLRTERSSEAGRAYVVIYEHQRIEALRRRFGITDDWLQDVIRTMKAEMPVGEEPAPKAEQTVMLNE